VLVATSGRQALEIMGRVRPDLILMDVMMPEMDGFEACALIKANESWRDIPLIFLTARTETSDLVRGFESGAVDYVAKPFNSHELLARVNTHLTVDQLRASLAGKNEELARAHALVRSAFGRYVSEEVAASILHSPEGLEMGGEEREVTILMSDLRGFTALSARLTPHQVIAFLNLYLEAMVEVIFRFEGTIDEIIGDAILVMFGAPVASADHGAKAVACALAMQLAMKDVNERIAAMSGTELEMGIGVHSGRVIVGNIGSQRRTKYAAVGANVNMAGRIESFTTGGQLLISQSTREQIASPLEIASEFEVQPKGSSQSIRLFDITAIGAPFNLSLPGQDLALRPLPVPLAVRFTILQDKAVGRAQHEALLTEISPRGARMRSELVVPALTNLQIAFEGAADGPPAGEFYAKVTEPGDGQSLGARLRFTSVPQDLAAWFGRQAGLPAALPAVPAQPALDPPPVVIEAISAPGQAGFIADRPGQG
jgi:adenylate cyclase